MRAIQTDWSAPLRYILSWLCLTATSCASTPEAPSHVMLISEMRLVLGVDENGRLGGVDVDHRVDATPSPESCNKLDGVAPDGTPGIDNQFSFVANLAISAIGGDPEALVQTSINDGQLLILIELVGVDDFLDDNDVTARIHVGSGTVNVDNRGFPEPGQTFNVQETDSPIEIRGVRIVDGVLDISGFPLDLDVSLLQTRFSLQLHDSRLRVVLGEGGETGSGYLGGGVETSEIREIIANDDALDEILPAVEPILGRSGDLVPNAIGGCARISAGVEVGLVRAFIFPR